MITALTRVAATAALLCVGVAAAPAASAQAHHLPPIASTPHVQSALDETDEDGFFDGITEQAEDVVDSLLGEGNFISETIIDGLIDDIGADTADGIIGGLFSRD
ncbi:hypothetical protein [Streptomyces sp. NPDC003832]